MRIVDIHKSSEFGLVAVAYDTVRGYLHGYYIPADSEWEEVMGIDPDTLDGLVYGTAIIEVAD